MFILNLVPILGAGMVWGPAAVYLALSSRWPGALATVTWGALNTVLVDYLLYVRLAGDRMRMHQPPALIALLGGMAVFGFSGMILGPVLFVVMMALLGIWRQRLRDVEAAPARADAAT
jgi:predicted PurR-regulated permease PerM